MESCVKGKKNTRRIGDTSESIITRFLELGYAILIPYGKNQRVDLLIEDTEGKFRRVQCKTARLDKNGTVLKFDTANHNVTGKNRHERHYRGQCDYFAAYCEKLKKVYMIPVDEVGVSKAILRLGSPKNNQEKNVRWAKDYEL